MKLRYVCTYIFKIYEIYIIHMKIYTSQIVMGILYGESCFYLCAVDSE